MEQGEVRGSYVQIGGNLDSSIEHQYQVLESIQTVSIIAL
jgi:hypothetical protein